MKDQKKSEWQKMKDNKMHQKWNSKCVTKTLIVGWMAGGGVWGEWPFYVDWH